MKSENLVFLNVELTGQPDVWCILYNTKFATQHFLNSFFLFSASPNQLLYQSTTIQTVCGNGHAELKVALLAATARVIILCNSVLMYLSMYVFLQNRPLHMRGNSLANFDEIWQIGPPWV